MENPNYYAIIPASVRYNKELSFLEKFLYCEFTALSNCDGYCIAKNKYFAKLYDKDEKTISRAISRLEELGFIRLEYERTGAKVTKRKIYINDKKYTSDKIVNRTEIMSDKNITREQEKYLLASDKIITENNSSYNILLSLILDYYKEKECKEKEKFIPPTLEEVKEYAKSRNRLDIAEKFFDYFTVGNWIDSKGKKVTNWKQKFITWEDNNKPVYQQKENIKCSAKQLDNGVWKI